MEFFVNADTPIATLNSRVMAYCGPPGHRLRLFDSSVILESGSTLADYGIRSRFRINATFYPIQPGIQVVIRFGSQLLNFGCQPDTLAMKLRLPAAERLGVPNLALAVPRTRRILTSMQTTVAELANDGVVSLEGISGLGPYAYYEYDEDLYYAEIEEFATVRDLKIQIRQTLGFPVGRQRIFSNGREMTDPMPIGRRPPETNGFGLVVVPESGWTLQVRFGNEIFYAPVENGRQPVSDIKFYMAEKLGIPAAEFDLIIPGRKIDQLDKDPWAVGINERTRLRPVLRVENGIEVMVVSEATRVAIVLPRENPFEELESFVRFVVEDTVGNFQMFVEEKRLTKGTEGLITNGAVVTVIGVARVRGTNRLAPSG
jgi:hypothetical protein